MKSDTKSSRDHSERTGYVFEIPIVVCSPRFTLLLFFLYLTLLARSLVCCLLMSFAIKDNKIYLIVVCLKNKKRKEIPMLF